MSWNNWTPDQYSAQRHEQMAEAASLARYLNSSGSAALDGSRDTQSAASDRANQALRGVTEALARLRPRFQTP